MLSGLFARGLGFALVVLGTAACAGATPKAEPKGPGAELDVARALFEDAVVDEEQHRFAQALQKLEMIRGVRDTPAVRFRIASCLEGSYRLREARTAYAKVAEATQRSPEDDAVVTASSEKLNMLEARIPAIFVQIADGKDAEVRVDDEPVVSTRGPLRVNPGDHHLAIMRKGYRTMDLQVRVGEGGRVKVYTMLLPEGQKPKPAAPKRPKTMPPSAARPAQTPSRESGS